MKSICSTQWVPSSKFWTGQWKYDGDQAKQELSLLMSLTDYLGILTLVVRRLDMGQALSRLHVIWTYKHCVLLSLRMLEHLCTTRTIMFEHVYWRLQSVSKLLFQGEKQERVLGGGRLDTGRPRGVLLLWGSSLWDSQHGLK